MPESHRWPEPKYTHWQKLHSVVDEARSRVSATSKAMDTINADPNLSATGKADACRKYAERAVAEAKASSTLENARVAVERMQEKWNAKIDEVIKPAEDVHTAMIYGKILDRVAAMPRESRLTFFQEHSDDLQIASALLLAPSFVSGLSDTELAVIRSKIGTRILGAEVVEARAAAEKALSVATKGWARSISLIEERAGLVPVEKWKAVA